MALNSNVAKYLLEHKDLIQLRKYEELYKYLNNPGYRGNVSCYDLTDTLLTAGINPIESGMKHIPNSFAEYTNIGDIDLSNVLTIGDYAFSECENITSVDLSETVDVGMRAFYCCPNLKSVKYGKDTLIGLDCFLQCSSLLYFDFGSTEIIHQAAFALAFNTDELHIPEGVKVIAISAFMDANINKIYLPSTILRVGTGCFYSEEGKLHIYCPQNVLGKLKKIGMSDSLITVI